MIYLNTFGEVINGFKNISQLISGLRKTKILKRFIVKLRQVKSERV